MDETLRVNGTAEIRDDDELPLGSPRAPPATVLTIHVREAFLHCGKALMRSKLWDRGPSSARSCPRWAR